MKTVPFEKLPLQEPLVNIMSSVDDLRIASVKIKVVQHDKRTGTTD
jgi:hypothetical protein